MNTVAIRAKVADDTRGRLEYQWSVGGICNDGQPHARRWVFRVCTSTICEGRDPPAAIAGATLPELMHRLGQNTPTAAMRYQHATSERHREVADRLGALLQPGAVEPEPVADVVNITGPSGRGN